MAAPQSPEGWGISVVKDSFTPEQPRLGNFAICELRTVKQSLTVEPPRIPRQLVYLIANRITSPACKQGDDLKGISYLIANRQFNEASINER